jgi:uncharacterized membrane protein
MIVPLSILKTISRWLLAALFVAAGTAHFLRPQFFEAIVPPYLPAPHLLVIISGILEIVLGLLLLVARTSRLAAWGLIALLVAVSPANVHMALHPERFPEFSSRALWLRLPMQLVLIAWAFWSTRTARTTSAPRT